MAAEHGERVTFVRLNVDENPRDAGALQRPLDPDRDPLRGRRGAGDVVGARSRSHYEQRLGALAQRRRLNDVPAAAEVSSRRSSARAPSLAAAPPDDRKPEPRRIFGRERRRAARSPRPSSRTAGRRPRRSAARAGRARGRSRAGSPSARRCGRRRSRSRPRGRSARARPRASRRPSSSRSGGRRWRSTSSSKPVEALARTWRPARGPERAGDDEDVARDGARPAGDALRSARPRSR